MTGTPVISLKNVRRSYGKYFELGPLDVEIEPGHIVAVVGPNGGGKSTLIGMLMNLIQPDSGDIRLFGCAYPDDEVAIKQRIGYVPERFLGQDDMSANSLGEFYSYWYPKWDHRLYEERVERLAIDPDRKFGKLSRGVQRRLAFALALATGPDLLLLDEPIEGVDPIARGEMIEDLSRFLDEGGMRAVLFATNVMEVVRRVADYVVLLADGEFLGLYEKDALRQEWKIFWVDREPQSDVPGVVEVESGRPTRIVSDSPHETAVALRAENIRIARREALDLQEILSHLMRRSREGSSA